MFGRLGETIDNEIERVIDQCRCCGRLNEVYIRRGCERVVHIGIRCPCGMTVSKTVRFNDEPELRRECFMQILDRISNIPITRTSMWEGKTSADIIQDIENFINMLETKPDELKPFWSAVRLENKKELERLNILRNNLQAYYPHPTGPIYFIGYKETPRGQADRWYMPWRRCIFEMVNDP